MSILYSRSLEHFLTVCESRSMSEAARRCGLTQPAITKSIRKLEDAIGAKLFQRGPTGLILTQFGDLLQRHAVTMRNQERYLEIDVASLREGRSGQLRMGVGHALALTILPPLIAALQSTYPNVAVEVETAVADELYPRLLDGSIDLMLASVVGLDAAPDIEVEALATMDMVVFAREGHPIWASEIRLEDILEHSWNIFVGDHEGQRAVVRYFARTGHGRPKVAFRSTALVTLLELTRRSNSLAYLTSSLTEEARRRNLKPLPLDPPIWSFDVGLLIRKPALGIQPVQFIRKFCRAAMARAISPASAG